VDEAKPRADSVLAALKAGRTLEQAAAAVRLAVTPIQTTRQQPEPRLAGTPEMLGMVFGAPPGKLVGPVRTSQGWWFARKDGVIASPDSLLDDQLRGQITTEVLSARQRRFFDAYIQRMRDQATIADARGPQREM